ncbi:helix-turn-helix domain-containing protein [Vagococcus intermedius]|uniref:Helix-turn-helix domain-containing protein n=1 Tax=Vagococcus intermedius TaxID=2991418 RepID=A0AAF0I9Q4_9ENTE|nr:helix-turn-helix domain-containing protein [Vagococcus intermedius]WEG73637.1 helix-turn-helix domain-containing protein [Vagococcus intermedius]
MKTNEYNQLNLLAYLADNKKHAYHTIGKELNVTKDTLHRYVNNLNYDLNTTQEDTIYYISIKKQQIFLNKHPDYSVYDLMARLIQKYSCLSPIYQILSEMLYQQSQSTLQLLNKLNLSHSYFNKLIKKINNFLKPYYIRLSQKNHMIHWEGNQIKLFFIQYLLWSYLFLVDPKMMAPRFIQSPLNFVSLDNYPFIEHPHIKLKLLQHTAYNYFAKNDHIVCDSALYKSLSNILFSEHNLLIPNQKKRLWLPESDKFLNLMIHLIAPYLISNQKREIIGKKFMELEHPSIQAYKNRITTLLALKSVPQDTTYHEIAYLLCLQQLSLEMVGTNFQHFFQLTILPDPFKLSNNQNLNPNLAILLEKDCSYYPINNLTYLARMTCPNHVIKLNIKIELSTQLPYETLFKKTITTLFNENTIKFISSDTLADIIITDQVDLTQSTEPYFFMPDLFDPLALESLFLKITVLYLSKDNNTQNKKKK